MCPEASLTAEESQLLHPNQSNDPMNSGCYFVLADFDAYAAAQQAASKAYAKISRWGIMSLVNTAGSHPIARSANTVSIFGSCRSGTANLNP